MTEGHELGSISIHTSASERPARTMLEHDDDGQPTTTSSMTSRLHKRTLLKLDCLLLPFLALLFLFNSLDKSNVSSHSLCYLRLLSPHLTNTDQIGNAESAHFTTDIGLAKGDLNTAVALFFAFFVTLQPVGAALGRKYGMVAWVPSCMLLWGLSTMAHVWVRGRWQLYALRIGIGCLEGAKCYAYRAAG